MPPLANAAVANKSGSCKQRTVGTVTASSDIGVMTEPDALGPCEPGTSVHLDGIVWHESDTGEFIYLNMRSILLRKLCRVFFP